MPLSHKPTHLAPYSDEENIIRNKPVSNNKAWQGGPRFAWVSHYGSKSSNKGDRSAKKGGGPRGRAPYERPTIQPSWAKKYTAQPERRE